MNKNVNQSLKRILKNINFENTVSKINTDKNVYYEAVEKYGITKRMNEIIDGFYEDTNTYSNLYNKIDLKIGIICDEFMYYALKDTADFVYIPFTENMEVNKNIDILLVVSSWRGLDHSWDYVANPKGRVRKSLIELIQNYKTENIKTVFYSKEDPVSYKQYLSIAKECDYILTSAKEMISEYKRDTGNDNIDFLEFGINPMYHNPVGKDLTDKKLSHIVTFAGSWMVRFPRRNKEALEIFNGVHKSGYGLSIVDRQFERGMERYHFPNFLVKNISETIPHERLMKLHKATKWGINLNSVQDSYTMFANRVYELQAMGNVIISNYNKGVHEKFPNVILANESKDVEIKLKEMTLKEQKRLIAEGISNVMLNHTSFHRIGKLANLLGFESKISSPKILVIGEGERTKASYIKQTYMNSEYIDGNEFEEQDTLIQSFDYLVFLSDNIEYGRRYLENLLSTFAYTNAEIVTMNEDKYKYSDKENYIKTLSMISHKAYKQLGNDENELVYFNIPRTEMETRDADETLMENSHVTLLIPVNEKNHRYLENKSLLNLNNINMDIKLVSYNETSIEVKNEIDRLKYKNPNISYLEFNNEKNIHSALNKAIDTVTTEYLTFLTPGNEISKYEFKKVTELLINNEYDLIVSKDNNLIKDISVENSDYLLLENNVKTDSVLYSTKFVQNNNLKFDESIHLYNNLFILNSLVYAEKIYKSEKSFTKSLNTDRITDISKVKLLQEYKKIEESKHKFLHELEYISDYSNQVFPDIFLNKYFPVFKEASKTEKAECLEILESIFGLYKQYYNNSDEKLNKIVELLLT